MAHIELTTDNIDQTIESNDTVVIDFWASWCGPCKAFKPVFEAASETHPDIVFASCNTEEQQELAAAFGIRSIPTIMVFREKVLIYSQPGALPASTFEQLLQQVKGLDMAKVHAEMAEREQQEAQTENAASA